MRNILTYLILATSCWGGGQSLWAQTSPEVTRYLIGTTGDTTSAGGLNVSYTIGDIITTTVFSLGGDIILTQGFQQPEDDRIVSNDDPLDVRISYNIFPNPTPEELYVELKSEKPIEIELALYDVQGKLLSIIPEQRLLLQGEKILTFNLDPLADGYYLLGMFSENRSQIQFFKIEKVH